MNKSSNKARNPRQERSIKTKIKMLEAGTRLFSEKGFYKTNSNEIAKAAGVAIGSFYAYFKDKKTLFIEIMNMHWEEQFRGIQLPQEDLTNIDQKEMMLTLVTSLAALHDIAPAIHQEQYFLAQTDADIKKVIDKWDQLFYDISLEYFKKWQAQGKLRVHDLESAARIFCTTIEENIHALKFSKSGIDESRVIKELTDMICRYLFADD